MKYKFWIGCMVVSLTFNFYIGYTWYREYKEKVTIVSQNTTESLNCEIIVDSCTWANSSKPKVIPQHKPSIFAPSFKINGRKIKKDEGVVFCGHQIIIGEVVMGNATIQPMSAPFGFYVTVFTGPDGTSVMHSSIIDSIKNDKDKITYVLDKVDTLKSTAIGSIKIGDILSVDSTNSHTHIFPMIKSGDTIDVILGDTYIIGIGK
jgi:hypothetical protein